MPYAERKIIIGDVHGCLQELQALLAVCTPTDRDEIIFLGDLVSKGPDSAGTVAFVRRLSQQFAVKLILGNHEEKLLRVIHNRLHNPEAYLVMTNRPHFEAIASDLTEEDLGFLRQAYYAVRLEELGYLLVHGGIGVNWKLDFSTDYRYLVHNPKDYKGLERLNRTRFLSPEGKYVALNDEDETSYFWADQYDGRFGTVIFGHQPWHDHQPRIFRHAIGIDTACVYGGRLTACILLPDGSYQFNSVPALNEPAAVLTQVYPIFGENQN
jgi:serine/threonine protein phosphatase 1